MTTRIRTRTTIESAKEEVRAMCNPSLERNFVRLDGAIDWAAADDTVRAACANRSFKPWALEYELFSELIREGASPIYARLREQLRPEPIDATSFDYEDNRIAGFSADVYEFALHFRSTLSLADLRVLEAYRPHSYIWSQVMMAMRAHGLQQHFATCTIITMIALAQEEMD
jgi:hypothetical protein